MSKWVRSNVLGLVAIFIALGGTAVAAQLAKNSVTSKSIKNGAVASKDVKDDDLTTADIDESTLKGIQGPAGPQGETGPAGPATGPAGGALTGTYPSPGIASNAIGSSQVAPDSLGADDIDEADLRLITDGECLPGLARGVVEISGAAVGASFGTAGVDNDNAILCTGQTIEARRLGTGQYCVRFNGLNHGFSIPFISLGAGLAAEANVFQDTTICPEDSYYVVTTASNGTHVDNGFQILAM